MLTDEELSIISIILEAGEPLTEYKIAKRMKVSRQNLTHRLVKLVRLGVLKELKDGKTRYDAHSILSCEVCLKDIATKIGEIANIINEHELSGNKTIEALFHFISQRVTIVNGGNPSKHNHLHA